MRFPLFIDLTGRWIIVFGGGTIATRRIHSLLPFGAKIVVVAPEISETLERLVEEKQIQWNRKRYELGDCAGAYMVLSCINSREQNHRIYEEAKKETSFYNVCDCKEESNFYFPGIAKKENVVVGITASGRNHSLARKVTEEIQNILE